TVQTRPPLLPWPVFMLIDIGHSRANFTLVCSIARHERLSLLPKGRYKLVNLRHPVEEGAAKLQVVGPGESLAVDGRASQSQGGREVATAHGVATVKASRQVLNQGEVGGHECPCPRERFEQESARPGQVRVRELVAAGLLDGDLGLLAP